MGSLYISLHNRRTEVDTDLSEEDKGKITLLAMSKTCETSIGSIGSTEELD